MTEKISIIGKRRLIAYSSTLVFVLLYTIVTKWLEVSTEVTKAGISAATYVFGIYGGNDIFNKATENIFNRDKNKETLNVVQNIHE